MKNLSKNNTDKEVMSKLTNANNAEDKPKMEEVVTSEDILYSLKPLMDEYFLGTAVLNGKHIAYQTLGGQKYCISVSEVK